MKIWLDFETYSAQPLKHVGAHIYAQDCDILIATYAFGDGPVRCWDATIDPLPPEDLCTALSQPGSVIYAHNAPFDRQVLMHARNRGELVCPPLERWRCTMAQALSNALPDSLDELGQVLGLPAEHAKIKEGKKLIQRFCQPAPKNHKADRYDSHSHPEEWRRFKDYAIRDVEAMRECHRRMPAWNYDQLPCELEVWFADQRINDRGFQVDRELVDAAVFSSDDEKQRLVERFFELTRQDEVRPSQRAKILDLLNRKFWLGLENSQAETLRGVLKRLDLNSDVRETLEIIIEMNKTSNSKYLALQISTSDDGRARGTLQWSGAGRTMRWAGRRFQGQNLPSRGLPDARDVEQYIRCVKLGIHTVMFNDLMLFGSAALRGAIIARPGKVIAAADLSNIEGRMLAWLAGETWKLQAFRDYDAGTGPDLYNITANMITGVDPWNVPKSMRNAFGKVPDLASGYAGGVSGYQNFARAYGVRMADHWPTIQQSVAPEYQQRAIKNAEKPWAIKQIEDLEISKLEWIASETCKLAWRARHPATVAFWYDLEKAAKAAIAKQGEVFAAGRVKLTCRRVQGHLWLQILLPSKRRLCYFDPSVTEDGRIMYWGMATDEGQTSRAWIPCFTHGGKLAGNVTQHSARDLLADNLVKIERESEFETVLTVHDEVVTEAPETACIEDLTRLLAYQQPWSEGLPLAAAGFISHRYRKD